MSYNIDTFKVKKLENLIIPFDSFFKCREDWHPERTNNDDGSVTLDSMESEIKGMLKDGLFEVTEIRCTGEGSGTTMNDIIEPALKDGKGTLIVSCVWEGGDCINKLTAIDGKVSWEDIEI